MVPFCVDSHNVCICMQCFKVSMSDKTFVLTGLASLTTEVLQGLCWSHDYSTMSAEANSVIIHSICTHSAVRIFITLFCSYHTEGLCAHEAYEWLWLQSGLLQLHNIMMSMFSLNPLIHLPRLPHLPSLLCLPSVLCLPDLRTYQPINLNLLGVILKFTWGNCLNHLVCRWHYSVN